MNAIVSRELFIDHCAMMGVPVTINEIHAMLDLKMKMHPQVKKVAELIQSGGIIQPPKDEPVCADEAVSKPRESIKSRRDAQLKRRPFSYYVQPVLDNLKGTDKCCAVIASELKQTKTMMQHILTKMQKEGLLDSQLIRKGVRQWFVTGYSTPQLAAFKIAKAAQAEAKLKHLQYYESAPCEHCGTTKRVTQSDRCVECSRIYANKLRLNRMKTKEL